MPEISNRLPPLVADEIVRHRSDVEKFLKGEITPDLFKSLRVPRGIYEQRTPGKYMLRLRLAGGVMTARQAGLAADAARRHGSDLLHVTTRQDLQLHNLDIRATPSAMEELAKGGLASIGGGGNTVRNISSCPYSGVCPYEVFDVTPYASALTEFLTASKGSYNLPRKYKIAFSGCGADCAMAGMADLGFIARARDGKPCFKVYSGGGMGAEPRIADLMLEGMPPEDVFRMAEAVRRIFDRFGDRKNRNRARLRFVFVKFGAEHMRRILLEEMKALAEEEIPSCPLRPEVNPGGQEGAGSAPPLGNLEGLKILRQRQEGAASILLQLKFGDLEPDTLSLISDIAGRFSRTGMLRTTQSQNIMISSVDMKDVPAVSERIRESRPGLMEYGAARHIRACTGAATCRLGLCLSQGAASTVAAMIDSDSCIDTDDPRFPDIRINGCPNACGQHPAASIGLAGIAMRNGENLYPAYRISLGGRTGDGVTRLSAVIVSVPAKRIPALISEILRDYFKGRSSGGEEFHEYFDRMGMDHFRIMAAQHSTPPAFDKQPEAYSDWGSGRPFSIEGRRPGECSSRIFSMVASDISSARKFLEDGRADGALRDDLFCKAILLGVRALLITRGVYSGNAGECADAFKKHFIDTGLVERKHERLLSVLKECCSGCCCQFKCPAEDVEEFIARLEYLYSTMDAGLNFHPEK